MAARLLFFGGKKNMATITKDTPRRIHQELLSPAELAIVAAIRSVEQMAADPRLTDAVFLLMQAQSKVADYIDGI